MPQKSAINPNKTGIYVHLFHVWRRFVVCMLLNNCTLGVLLDFFFIVSFQEH